MSTVDTTRLDQAFERLRVYDQRDTGLDSHFRELILHGKDESLNRINAYRLASSWNVTPHSVLLWLLYATQVGLFDLNWETQCPHCTGTSKVVKRLGAIGHDGECKMCQTNFAIHSDENIEVTFSITRTIRTALPNLTNYLTYNEAFLGTFDGKQPVELHLDRPGKYFLAAFEGLRFGGVYRINVEKNYALLSEVYVTFYPEVTSPKQSQSGLGKITVYAEGALQLLGLYRDDNHPKLGLGKVTALEIMLLPEFKQIFASDSLSQRESLSIKNLTLMFTDITGSTAMYKRFGDVRAYNLVRDHFEVLFTEIDKRKGVVVKTIGDAVMAAFPAADEAVCAALEVQHSIRVFNHGRDPEQGVILLKIGLHSGSAIAVNLNDRLDYFGNMVNMAARIQSKSRSEEILLSEVVYADPHVQEVLASDTSLVVVDNLFELHGIGEQRLYSIISQVN
jgi:adenylate cyclase